MIATEMLIELWPIDRPIEYSRNARMITQAAVDKVAASIKEFGFRQPVVVDKDGVIIVGHVRSRAARKLGMTHVPVHVAANLTPAQVRAYRLMETIDLTKKSSGISRCSVPSYWSSRISISTWFSPASTRASSTP